MDSVSFQKIFFNGFWSRGVIGYRETMNLYFNILCMFQKLFQCWQIKILSKVNFQIFTSFDVFFGYMFKLFSYCFIRFHNKSRPKIHQLRTISFPFTGQSFIMIDHNATQKALTSQVFLVINPNIWYFLKQLLVNDLPFQLNSNVKVQLFNEITVIGLYQILHKFVALRVVIFVMPLFVVFVFNFDLFSMVLGYV